MRSTDFPFAVMPQGYAVRRFREGGASFAAKYPGLLDSAIDEDFGREPTDFAGRDTLAALPVSGRDRLKDKLAVMIGRSNAERVDGVASIADFTPAGAASALDESVLALRKGNRGEAAANLLLGVLPLPGPVKKAVKGAAGKVTKAIKGDAPTKAAPLAVRGVANLQRVRAPNAVDPQHLRTVVREMKKLGAPTIRVVKFPFGGYAALEGSHRLAAAKELGIKPNFQIVSPKATMHSSELPEDLTSEFYLSKFHDDLRDDSVSAQNFVLPGDMLQKYAANNFGLSYSPKDFRIKSAIGNRGTYDPDISKARGGLMDLARKYR